MGNEASRAAGDGLSPHALSPGASPGVPPSPRTTAGVRRTKSFSSSTPTDAAPSHVDRTIQRMDKTIRKRVRGGITYNMKIILRGDRGTGKSSLFQRLKGEPIPSTHEPTPQLQSATINWSFRANSEESVKCDVWDVVDKGFHPAANANGDVNPFEAQAANGTTGAHMVATVDATTVDVYHETHGVVFLLDVTKPHTLEYVRQQLDHVPVHIPTLVLGNFRDLGSQRKIFKEDIQELLYGGENAHHQPLRRPHELLYFECSLLNCYGLKSLHQYFGIPFLQLKQHTIRQQLRILEGEFTHLKHDLQAKIAEQKYADYLEHIKATGSDIRTGRRAAASPVSPGTVSTPNEETTNNGEKTQEAESPTPKTRLDRTLSSSSDIVINSDSAPTALQTPESPVPPSQPPSRQVDLEDLPERTAALAQAGNSLKIDYTEEERRAAKKPIAMPPLPGTIAPPVVAEDKPVAVAADTVEEKPIQKPQREAKTSGIPSPPPSNDAPMTLEDFQVPKPRHNDLDSFYSDESSEEDAGTDDDVVISAAGARMAKSASMKYHKQVFLDSDDSDSEVEKKQARQGKGRANASSKRRSPRRQATKPSTDVPSSTSVTNSISPSPPSPVRPSSPARAAPSPPAPTSSPSHSPRRRVRESEAAGTPDQPITDSEQNNSADTSSEMPPLPFTHLLQKSSSSNIETEQVSVSSPASTTIEPKDNSGQNVASNGAVEQGEETEVGARTVTETTPVVDDEPDVVESSVNLEKPTTHKPSDPVVEQTSPQEHLSEETSTPVVEEAQEEEAEDLVVSATEAFFNGEGEDEGKVVVQSDQLPLENSNSPVDAMPQVNAPAADVKVTLIEASEPVHNTTELEEEEEPEVPRSSGIVSQLKQRRSGVELSLTDDDSDENGSITPPKPVAKPVESKPSTTTRERKVEIIMSDDDDSDDAAPAPPPRATNKRVESLQSANDLTSFPSPLMAPAAATGSGSLGDILEAFLNDSASDSDMDSAPSRVIGTRATMKPAVVDESDEDSGNDRFAAYDRKRSSETRKTASRRMKEDFFMTSSTFDEHGLSGSSSRTSSFSTVGETSSVQTASIANSEVLAAIRQAEEDARRMLEASTPITPPRRVELASEEGEETKKKKKKSSSSSSSRRKKDLGDGVDGERTKPKKKKDKISSSSRSSKRREILLTDEDE